MTVHYDEKGKYFTDVISKEKVEVIIQTEKHLIYGFMHARHNQRLKDELNANEQFLAITNAKIMNESGEELYSPAFIAVNKDNIVWITPKTELDQKADQEEGNG